MIFRIVSALLVLSVALAVAHGSACTVRANGMQGTCTPIIKCAEVKKAILSGRRDHTSCGFQGFTEIVCCPGSTSQTTKQPTVNPSSSDRISVRKCFEYKEAVYEYKNFTTILGHDERKIDRCAADSTPLIVGGNETRQYEFPHMALLGYRLDQDDLAWLCGGALISEYFVLTAGHCMVSREYGEPQKIRLGAHDLRNIGNDDDHTIDYNIAERIRHPEYRASSQYNDIALIKMDRAVPLTPYVRPACLPTMAAVPTTRAIATGWGHLQWKGSPSDVLLKVTLDMFTHSECNQTYEFHINRRLRHGIVDETQVCAGSHEGEKDTCQGDSGGPLQVFHPSHFCMYTIVGVTSFGTACGVVDSPGVYTRVFAYLPWIEQTVWPNE